MYLPEHVFQVLFCLPKSYFFMVVHHHRSCIVVEMCEKEFSVSSRSDLSIPGTPLWSMNKEWGTPSRLLICCVVMFPSRRNWKKKIVKCKRISWLLGKERVYKEVVLLFLLPLRLRSYSLEWILVKFLKDSRRIMKRVPIGRGVNVGYKRPKNHHRLVGGDSLYRRVCSRLTRSRLFDDYGFPNDSWWVPLEKVSHLK